MIKELTNKDAKVLIPRMMNELVDLNSVLENKKKNNLSEDDLRKIINDIVDNNPNSITDYKNGLDRAVKYLMGQVMKETKGSINPSLANKMLIEILESK